jgi:hypothetical protein
MNMIAPPGKKNQELPGLASPRSQSLGRGAEPEGPQGVWARTDKPLGPERTCILTEGVMRGEDPLREGSMAAAENLTGKEGIVLRRDEIFSQGVDLEKEGTQRDPA